MSYEIKNGVLAEFKHGVGWQDPAVIEETGLCVWRSGVIPVLEMKYNPDWLKGKMLIFWTGKSHKSPELAHLKRDYELIAKASKSAALAVSKKSLHMLGAAIDMSYKVQLGEGMEELPKMEQAITKKYLGGGHGGYALYVFETEADRNKAARKYPQTKVIEPYIRGFEV